MKFEDQGQALAYDIVFWLAGFKEPDYPADQLGALSVTLSEKLRALGIMALLAYGDSDRFFHNLMASATVRKLYLERCHARSRTDDYHACSGRINGLLDAIAAGDIALALAIGNLTSVGFRAEAEYEDDFSFAQTLFLLIQDKVDRTRFIALEQRWDQFLDGKADPRLDVCRALIDGDQALFDKAFHDLIAARGIEIANNRARGQLEEPVVVAERMVYVEGLALLRIADRVGLATLPEYDYCPSLARLPMIRPYPGF